MRPCVVKDTVNGNPRVDEISLVEEPAIMAVGLTNVEGVHTTGQRVQTNDDVHVVAVDGICDNAVKELNLVTRVQLGARGLHP